MTSPRKRIKVVWGHSIVPTFFWWVGYPLINLTIDFTCFDPGRLCDFNALPVTSQAGNRYNQSQEKIKKDVSFFSLAVSRSLSLLLLIPLLLIILG